MLWFFVSLCGCGWIKITYYTGGFGFVFFCLDLFGCRRVFQIWWRLFSKSCMLEGYTQHGSEKKTSKLTMDDFSWFCCCLGLDWDCKRSKEAVKWIVFGLSLTMGESKLSIYKKSKMQNCLKFLFPKNPSGGSPLPVPIYQHILEIILTAKV